MRKWMRKALEVVSVVGPLLLILLVICGSVCFMLWWAYLIYTGLMHSPPDWGKAVFGMFFLAWFTGTFTRMTLKAREDVRTKGADPLN